MSLSPEEALRKVIDDGLAPVISDHYEYLANAAGPTLPVARAELHYVSGHYHSPLLDFAADMMPVGHRNAAVVEAIKFHLEYYVRTGPVGRHVVRWPIEYAKKIAQSFVLDEEHQSAPQVLFTEGEREAVTVAIDAARAFSQRCKVVLVDTGRHDWYRSSYSDDTRTLSLDEADHDWIDTGALLMSPTTTDGRVLSAGWLRTIAAQAKAHGVPVIFDESVTGFGRTGTMWSQHNVGVMSDLTVLGGPVGGGMALGAVVGPPEYFHPARFDVSPQAGSSLACTAGAATMNLIIPGVLEHIRSAGAATGVALADLVEQFPAYLTSQRGVGLFRTVEFQNAEMAKKFEVDARRHGLLTAPPVESSVVLTPTLIASEVEVLRGVDLIAAVLLEWQERDTSQVD